MTDELELLRDWDADAAPLTEQSRAQARHRLLNAITHADPHHHPHPAPSRRRALRLATATLAGAALTGTAVLITADADNRRENRRPDRAAPQTPRMAEVSAVTVLNGAAAWTSRRERPVAPRDDQYIYSQRIIRETETRTGKVTTYKDENWDSVDGSRRSLTMELGRVIWEEPMGTSTVWPPREWSKLKKLPTDPEKLIPVIHNGGPSRRSLDTYTPEDWSNSYFMLGELLKWPLLPKGLRPAAYEALALVPGVKAVPGMKDSAGRAGVGIAFLTDPHFTGTYLIFDPKTYAFLGFRAERTSASGKKKYIQLSHVVNWGIVDELREHP